MLHHYLSGLLLYLRRACRLQVSMLMLGLQQVQHMQVQQMWVQWVQLVQQVPQVQQQCPVV